MSDERSSFILHRSSFLQAKGAPLSERPFSKQLGLVRANLDLDAAIELAPFRCAVRRPRLRLAVPDGLQARAANAEILEVISNRFRTPLGKPLVVRSGADRVGVTLHGNRGGRVL